MRKCDALNETWTNKHETEIIKQGKKNCTTHTKRKPRSVDINTHLDKNITKNGKMRNSLLSNKYERIYYYSLFNLIFNYFVDFNFILFDIFGFIKI